MAGKHQLDERETRSFLMARDPSIDRRFRPRPERQVRLFDDVEELSEDDSSAQSYKDGTKYDETSSKELVASVEEQVCEGNGASVYLRLRPVEQESTVYSLSEERNVLIVAPSAESSSTSNNKKSIEKHYSFSEIFDSEVEQREVYEKCMENTILNEDSFTVFTYGTSGSGKTFTLLGDEERPGIIPRALENIFSLHGSNIHQLPALKLEKASITILDDKKWAKEMQLRRQIFSACAEMQTEYTRMQQIISEEHGFKMKEAPEIVVVIWVSFVEIYNENVYDLLATPPTGLQQTISAPPRKNLQIICNDGNVFIKNLTTVFVKSSIEALKLLRYGLQRVTYAHTSINENSSRSHCIFFVDVLKYFHTGLATATAYKFCDLAGSERLMKTTNIGSRLKEAQRINTSLLVLGRCLEATNNSRKKRNVLIPFRESKLTMLMQSPLLGKEKLIMVATVTPTDSFYEENINVLGFSSIARNIIFKPPVVKQNNSRYSIIVQPPNNDAQKEYVEQLMEENAYLRNELVRRDALHETELQQQEHDLRNEIVDFFKNSMKENSQRFEIRLQRELDSQKRMHEAKITTLKRQYEAVIGDLREEIEDFKENTCVKDPTRRRRSSSN